MALTNSEIALLQRVRGACWGGVGGCARVPVIDTHINIERAVEGGRGNSIFN